jgi:benzoyl-CoA 2,3-dioxygenase component B
MLKEEAHHMFVGTTGIDRVVTRTAELMREHDSEEVAAAGGIPLDVIQRYLNFHYSVSLDLFGSETSTNAANYFTAGLKGRWQEERRRDDHVLTDDSAAVDSVVDGQLGIEEVPALLALNHDLREEYVRDCQGGIKRWNRILSEHGIDDRLRLPHAGFNREVGRYADHHVSPDGRLLSESDWRARRDDWLPTPTDKAHVRSLMQPVHQQGRIASWIAPPRNGINGKPFDYEYVHFA